MAETRSDNDWLQRVVEGASLGAVHPPDWLSGAYQVFRKNINDEKYPCYFGTQAERRKAVYYSYVEGNNLSRLPETLTTFLSLCPDVHRDKNNLVVFFEPESQERSHVEYRKKFWQALQYLHDHDPSSRGELLDPTDPRWDFSFAGRLFFVVGASPSYQLHRSRNLGASMVMIFQPREVFHNGEVTTATRNLIRRRAELWDGTATHPDLNSFGNAGNLEWAQYFFSDDNRPEAGRCPLAQHRRAVL